MPRFGRGHSCGYGWGLGVLGMTVLACVVALSGCDLGGGGGTSGAPTAGVTATTALTSATATLAHQPTGTADLTYSASAKTLTVKMNLTGLAPTSMHAAHIHSGHCGSNGAIVHALNSISANGVGGATLNQTIDNVTGGIPASGWYLNVHNGTASDEFSLISIACVNITPTTTTTSAGQTQTAHLTLAPGEGPSENSSGKATLAIQGGNLVVTITMSGLEPTSTHAAHIHTGSCTSQGNVVYPLNNVTADGSGNATSTTTLKNVTSIPSGWLVRQCPPRPEPGLAD